MEFFLTNIFLQSGNMSNQSIYNPDFVEKVFDRMSVSYERMNYITSFGFSIRWRYQMLAFLDNESEEPEILDLMTGMGETWHIIKKKFPKAKITALDFSSGMLAKANFKNKKKLIAKYC